jgi:hypothetical protein
MNKVKSAILAFIVFFLFVVVALTMPAPPTTTRADSYTETPTPTATNLSGGHGPCEGDPGTCQVIVRLSSAEAIFGVRYL